MATRVQSQRGGALIGIRSHVSVYIIALGVYIARGALTLSCVPASDFCSFSAFRERCVELGAAIETEGDSDSKRSQKHQRHTREYIRRHGTQECDVRAAEGKYYHVTPKRAWLNV